MKQESPNRILMTADTVGGVWTYCLELATALQSADIHIALATMGAPMSRGQRQEAAAVRNVEIFESSHKLEWMKDPWADVAAAGEWLLELERKVRPDVIHLNNYAHGALAWRTPRLIVGHSCVLSWWQAVHGAPAPDSWNSYREVVGTGLKAVDAVVAPSRAMEAMLREHYGTLPPTYVIPNGRELRACAPQPKESFILSAGRIWDEAKNISALAAIAPALQWPVYVAGAERELGAGCAASVTNRTGVRHLGRLDAQELVCWLNRASIYALPARYEPFGLSILEAALAGCALVLGDIPSLREIWEDAAVFVSPADTDALKAALEELAGDAVKRAEFSARAQAMAGVYTPEAMGRNYLRLYSKLLAEGSRCAEAGTQYGSLTESGAEGECRPERPRSVVCAS